LFEKYNFSATWAVVGQLMLDGCILKNGIKYPLIIRPNYKWYKKDWFEKIPINKRANNSIWFDKNIIEMIMNCKVKQEIASHSFSHIIFGDEGCSKECAESDIKKCIEIARKNNIIFRSFIFPRNSEGYKNLLKKNGFICYRGKENVLYKKIKNKYYRKLIHLMKEIFTVSPKSSKVIIDENGLVNIRASMLYLSRDGIRKYIPIKNRVIRAKNGIDQAIKNNEVFHLWFHPQNICNDSIKLLSGLEEILRYSKNRVGKVF